MTKKNKPKLSGIDKVGAYNEMNNHEHISGLISEAERYTIDNARKLGSIERLDFRSAIREMDILSEMQVITWPETQEYL